MNAKIIETLLNFPYEVGRFFGLLLYLPGMSIAAICLGFCDVFTGEDRRQ